MPRSADALAPKQVVDAGLCIGCGACAAAEPRATMRWDRYGQLKPAGPADWYAAPDATFARTCPFSPTAANEDAIAAARFPAAPVGHDRLGRLETTWIGHVAEPGFRANGSSGGMVTWVAAELLRTGAVDAVAHVSPVADPAPGGPFFRYGLSRSVADLAAGAKSRYHPVHLTDVLRAIRETPGRYAVVGIPCFIKAVHLARAADPAIADRVTHLLGLFCGHMKSARLVESFAWQTGAPVDQVQAVDYRIKDEGRPANWYRAHLTLRDGSTASEDWWNLADGDWGAGFFQNGACDACDDVAAETADIAFGDAWIEPYSSDGRGTNVVVVRSPEFAAIVGRAVGEGRLALEPAAPDVVAGTQAAGFRHRREGLAYRLTWKWRRGLRPVKRVAPSARGIAPRRRLVYRTRHVIARWSHRLFWLARRTGRHGLYLRTARAALALYGGLAWGHGRIGRLADRLAPRAPAG